MAADVEIRARSNGAQALRADGASTGRIASNFNLG